MIHNPDFGLCDLINLLALYGYDLEHTHDPDIIVVRRARDARIFRSKAWTYPQWERNLKLWDT